MNQEDKKLLSYSIIITAILFIMLYMFPPNQQFENWPQKESVCIERYISPCENESCGAYYLSIYDYMFDCKIWSKENNYGHDGVHWCIEKFQRLDSNCTKWIEVYQ